VETSRLGRTDIELTRIGLGCGNFGGVGSDPATWGQGESEEEAYELLDAAVAAGIGFLDTAASYGGGRSEASIGNWRDERGSRVLLSSKVFSSVTGDPDDHGLAGDRILREIEGTLERLRTDRLDLYLTHAPDPETPIEETLRALDELVRAGKVRAVGGSNLDAEQLEDALETSERLGLVRYEWVQNEYSLLERGSEDVMEICEREGLGFTPFSPLAGGWLTGKYRRGESYPAGSRMTTRPGPYEVLENDRTFEALEAFEAAASERGVAPGTLAIAWILGDPRVTAVIAGPRRPEQLEPYLAALELPLSEQERDDLARLFP